jgi:heme oxygenase
MIWGMKNQREPESQAPSLAAFLKAGTQGAHREAERSSVMVSFRSPSLDQQSYKHSLTQLFRVLAPIEAAVKASPRLASFPSVGERAYFDCLLADLDFYGLERVPAREGEPGLDLSSLPSLAGVLYVVEGAANGGRVIGAEIARRLGINKTNGLCYFATQAELGEGRWAGLRSELDNRVPKAEYGACLESALEAFRRFRGEA